MRSDTSANNTNHKDSQGLFIKDQDFSVKIQDSKFYGAIVSGNVLK